MMIGRHGASPEASRNIIYQTQQRRLTLSADLKGETQPGRPRMSVSISLAEASARSGVPVGTLRLWCREWPAFAHWLGRGWRVVDLDRLIAAGKET
jgi:hypothetical protein